MAIGIWPGWWHQKKYGQTVPFGTSLDLGEILPWPPQILWIPKLSLTNSAFQWLIIWLQMVSDLWVTSIGTQPGYWIGNSGQIVPFGTNQVFGEISPWPPQILRIPKLSLTNSAFFRLLTLLQLMHGSTTTSFQTRVMVLNFSGQTRRRSEFSCLGA
jgi:hypothetical protein